MKPVPSGDDKGVVIRICAFMLHDAGKRVPWEFAFELPQGPAGRRLFPRKRIGAGKVETIVPEMRPQPDRAPKPG